MAVSRPAKTSTAPAVDRTIRILSALADSERALGASELSRALGLNKSTVHNILTRLCAYHLVEREDSNRSYRLGFGLVQLARGVLNQTDLYSAAHPWMMTLAAKVQESTFLGVFTDDHIVIIEKQEAPHDLKITSPIGRRLSPSAGAFGKVFLAALPDPELIHFLRQYPLRAYTPKAMTKPTAYRQALRQVRRQGFALDDEEYVAGTRAVASPIVDVQGRVIATLCVVGFSPHFSKDKLLLVAKETRDAAERISRQLGAPTYPSWNGIA